VQSPLASQPDATAPWLRRGIVVAFAVVAAIGAAQLAFLCDDAFIHFRYVANAHAGHGLVWNPEPFRPVEGGGFLWVLVLWALWSWFGQPPDLAANPFLIACGVVQVLIVAAAAMRMCRRDGARVPMVVVVGALVVIVGNRTFLQWMSSGLDTALSNVFLLGWVLHAFRAPERRGPGWLAIWSALAAFAALTRPDGLPLVAATAFAALCSLLRAGQLRTRTLASLSPLLLVVAHLLWRRAYYGEWLPNTYFAKVNEAWPEAGLRYFACFALENGAWAWPPILGLCLLAQLRRLRACARTIADHLPAVVAAGTAAFNAGYYTLAAGGDHFEYRVLAFLVPLATLACVAAVARVANGPRLPLATAVLLAAAGSAGWMHLAWQRHATTPGLAAVAPHAPAFAQPLTRWFDRQQAWLFSRYIGLRVAHHRWMFSVYSEVFPHTLTVPESAKPFPMFATGAVGLPAYRVPDCVILDHFGLNDWVVARTPPQFRPELTEEKLQAAATAADGNRDGALDLRELREALATAVDAGPSASGAALLAHYMMDLLQTEPGRVPIAVLVEMRDLLPSGRLMAHEHAPPPGYFEAFEPNIENFVGGVATVRPRKTPMTAERIRAIEAEWWARIRQQRSGR